jgi:hypothetical protein
MNLWMKSKRCWISGNLLTLSTIALAEVDLLTASTIALAEGNLLNKFRLDFFLVKESLFFVFAIHSPTKKIMRKPEHPRIRFII